MPASPYAVSPGDDSSIIRTTSKAPVSLHSIDERSAIEPKHTPSPAERHENQSHRPFSKTSTPPIKSGEAKRWAARRRRKSEADIKTNGNFQMFGSSKTIRMWKVAARSYARSDSDPEPSAIGAAAGLRDREMARFALKFKSRGLESRYQDLRAQEILHRTMKAIVLLLVLDAIAIVFLSFEPESSLQLTTVSVIFVFLMVYLALLYKVAAVQHYVETTSAICAFVTNILIASWAAFGVTESLCAEWQQKQAFIANQSLADAANLWPCVEYTGVRNNALMHYYLSFCTWFVFCALGATLLKFRFWASVLAAVPSMVISMAGTVPNVTASGSLGLALYLIFVTYLPGLMVCTLGPRELEISHRRNFLLVRDQIREIRSMALSMKEKQKILKMQSSDLRKKIIAITQMEERLDEAQKLVTAVMEEKEELLAQYEIWHDDLERGNAIGEGAFGTVYYGVLRGIHEVAIKTMRVSKVTTRELKKFRRELLIMCPLRHVNIVQLHGGCWNEGADKLCIVLEYCSNGSLISFFEVQKTHGNALAWEGLRHEFALGIAKGLHYLHEGLSEPLIHRDVKPDNVMVTSNLTPKLGDFGESRTLKRPSPFRKHLQKSDDPAAEVEGEASGSDSRELENVLTMTMVGTKLYCAPEVMSGQPYNNSCDVFSFSLVLANLVFADMDWIKSSCLERSAHGTWSHYVGGWRPEIPVELRESCNDLVSIINECWSHDITKRPPFSEIEPRLKKCTSLGSFEVFLAQRRKDEESRLNRFNSLGFVDSHIVTSDDEGSSSSDENYDVRVDRDIL